MLCMDHREKRRGWRERRRGRGRRGKGPISCPHKDPYNARLYYTNTTFMQENMPK